MNIDKEVDQFIENIKSIEEYTNEVNNNSELLKNIANEYVETTKIKKELNDSINTLNSTNVKNAKSLESNFNKINQREKEIQQQINTVLQNNEELSDAIKAVDNANAENKKILENNFNKTEQREKDIQQQLTIILQRNEEQNGIINDNINSLKLQILELTKICKIGLGLVVFSIILLVLLLFIK